MSSDANFSRGYVHPSEVSNTSMSVAQHVQNLLDRCGPRRVLGGPVTWNEEWRQPEDEALLKKTEHVRRPGEKLIELIARTGISPLQILNNDKEWIAQFCWRAGVNNEAQDVREPQLRGKSRFFNPKGVCRDPQPTNAVIVGA